MTTSADEPFRRAWKTMAILFLVIALFGWTTALSYYRTDVRDFSGPTMGTRYTVRIVDDSWMLSDPLDVATIQQQVDQRLLEINRLMSTYDPDSELSKFNLSTGDDWFAVSAETVQVVEFALKVAVTSDGAFDPTVGPLVNLWGFGPEKDREVPPAEADVAEAMAVVGYDKLQARLDPPALRKSTPGLYLDLSAIAKGYAVDEISTLLDRLGHSNSMVEIGGEVRTRGTKPGDIAWRIGVEKPDTARRSVKRVIELRDAALATSGDYRNFFERDGVRYSHTINPATGRPVQHELTTITVLAPSCMEADALATALLVMGDRRGYDWSVEREVAALLMIRDQSEVDGIRELPTPKFLELQAPEANPK